ncbi:FecR family protein [Pedobacter nyackensis]|uniref:FecR family protein n=1 Tax=Pedobacter nyackensis TaxID=475255 RepID=UPI0029307E3D|nr:FecR family protein [Pedobacter nyackensis]
MNTEQAKSYLKKYNDGTASDAERVIVESWQLSHALDDYDILDEELKQTDLAEVRANLVRLSQPAGFSRRPWPKMTITGKSKTIKLLRSNLIRKIAVAAIALLSISIGYYFIQKKELNQGNTIAKYEQILPGGNKAVLTLADGTTINLNNARKGRLKHSSGVNIVKTDEGKIVYNTNVTPAQEVTWNTLSIPAGGYYNVTLSDGTIVWLNAKSSLKYPTEFIGDSRVVELSGEGYFEVTHRKHQPFKVITEHQTIEVLGTHFNINAYKDEQSTTTTLLQGSIRVNALGIQKILIPNQQAKLNGGNMTITQCNTENVIDWVNNDFIFDNESLGSIMRKISRWYNVEVYYPKQLVDLQFSGFISRKMNIEEVLKIMELTQLVTFKIEGRRITVMQ